MKGVYQTVHVPKLFCMWPNLSCSGINSVLLETHLGRERNKFNPAKILNGKERKKTDFTLFFNFCENLSELGFRN